MERPIIFSGRMVRAILAGEKTQTRRILKHPTRGVLGGSADLGYMLTRNHVALLNGPDYPDGPDDEVRCPHGIPSDKLWLRETWCSGDEWALGGSCGQEPPAVVRYRADNSALQFDAERPASCDTSTWSEPKRWRSPIHMPRWASRITLEITGLRVELIKNITEADVRAEGIPFDGTHWLAGTHPVKGTLQCWPTPQRAFERAWEEIHGKAVPWASNPWVWVIEFRREQRLA